MASTDFTATVEGPITIFKAVSPAARTWLRTSGKADSGDPSTTRRDGASASIFLEALKRKGFSCDLPESWEKRSLGPTDTAGASAGFALGCAALIGVLGIGGFAVSGMFGGGDERPAAQPAQTQSNAPTCSLPDFVDMTKAGALPEGLTDPDKIIRQQVADVFYVRSIAYALPTIERKDDYEPTATYWTRAVEQLNAWKAGDLSPQTRMLIVTDPAFDPSYNADSMMMELYETSSPYAAQVSEVKQERKDSEYTDRATVKLQTDTLSSNDLFFTNIGSLSDTTLDGMCAQSYRTKSRGQSISFRIRPEEARKAARNLKVFYVVSFEAPKSASKGEWCYTGMESIKTTMLIPGGLNQHRTETHYTNVRLNQMIVSAGSKVYWSKTY